MENGLHRGQRIAWLIYGTSRPESVLDSPVNSPSNLRFDPAIPNYLNTSIGMLDENNVDIDKGSLPALAVPQLPSYKCTAIWHLDSIWRKERFPIAPSVPAVFMSYTPWICSRRQLCRSFLL